MVQSLARRGNCSPSDARSIEKTKHHVTWRNDTAQTRIRYPDVGIGRVTNRSQRHARHAERWFRTTSRGHRAEDDTRSISQN